MTAFLFIPAATGASSTRRVDLADFASLFAEVEEPTVRTRGRGPLVARLLATLLVVMLAIGDTILVARPYALTHAPTGPATGAVPVTSL